MAECFDAAADGEEGGALLVGFADVGDFSVGGLVTELAGADEGDVERGACLERVLWTASTVSM